MKCYSKQWNSLFKDPKVQNCMRVSGNDGVSTYNKRAVVCLWTKVWFYLQIGKSIDCRRTFPKPILWPLDPRSPGPSAPGGLLRSPSTRLPGATFFPKSPIHIHIVPTLGSESRVTQWWTACTLKSVLSLPVWPLAIDNLFCLNFLTCKTKMKRHQPHKVTARIKCGKVYHDLHKCLALCKF